MHKRKDAMMSDIQAKARKVAIFFGDDAARSPRARVDPPTKEGLEKQALISAQNQFMAERGVNPLQTKETEEWYQVYPQAYIASYLSSGGRIKPPDPTYDTVSAFVDAVLTKKELASALSSDWGRNDDDVYDVTVTHCDGRVLIRESAENLSVELLALLLGIEHK